MTIGKGDITIRKYQAADKAVAGELFEKGMLDHVGPETPEKYAADLRMWTAKEKADFFSNVSGQVHEHNGGCMFVAVNDAEQIVGTVAVRVSDDNLADCSAELLRMSVRGAERRSGIGKSLLDYAIAYCRVTLKSKSVWLTTNQYMEMAVKFYLKNGFTIDPDYRYVIPGYEPGEVDIIKFRRSL